MFSNSSQRSAPVIKKQTVLKSQISKKAFEVKVSVVGSSIMVIYDILPLYMEIESFYRYFLP